MRVSARALQRAAAQILDTYSQYNPSPLTIKHFIDFAAKASHERSFLFLRKELPVRLANIMQEIRLLPDKLLETPSVRQVQGWYEQSLEDLAKYISADTSPRVVNDFTDDLELVRDRHRDVVETMAKGVIEYRDAHGLCNSAHNQIQYFLDRFFMSRISIRMLINQHTLMFGDDLNRHPRHIGCIDPHCDVISIINDAYSSARQLCEHYYMDAPAVNIHVYNAVEHLNHVKMVYVPSHLYHVLFEVLKNAMRAVVEYQKNADELPPLNVLVCKGTEDVTIKISDRGGGIRRSQQDLLFNYMYSTAPTPDDESNPHADRAQMAPMAGYGYGLPLSRLYAKYLHGDLTLSSADGAGTDVTLALKVFPAHAAELLPVFTATSQRQYSTNIPIGDWSDPQHTTGLHNARC